MKKLTTNQIMINNQIKDALKYGSKSFKLRPIHQTGKGRYAKYGTDHTNKYTSYLDELNVKYTIGNDAPKGGVLGKFIEVQIDKRNKFIKALSEEKK